MADNNKILKYTPLDIANSKQIFNIPLYQRLFEWSEDQIVQLMYDLHHAFLRNDNKPYFIGMLTAMKNKKNGYLDLVDGQQRFTVMMLLGICFKWKKFLSVLDCPRLRFAARESDEQYLKALISGKVEGDDTLVVNEKMRNGIGYIKDYVKRNIPSQSRNDFCNYVYNNLTFFISVLEDSYTSTELNVYFERMNTTGKALEAHEILKVEMLSEIKRNRELYTKLWNACSQMDRRLMNPVKYNQEQEDATADEGSYGRCRNNYSNAIREKNLRNKLSSIKLGDESEKKGKSICKVDADGERNPNQYAQQRRKDVHAMLTFPEFLLQVLYITLGCAENVDTINRDLPTYIDINGDSQKINVNDFFNVHKLYETFDKYKDLFKVEDFFKNLLQYRLVMDYYICQVSENDDEHYPFRLYNGGLKNEILQYETMLYSASSAMTYYYWFAPLLVWLNKKVLEHGNVWGVDGYEFLEYMKELDLNWHPNPFVVNGKTVDDGQVKANLRYGNIDRYYFWRIDYYLWKNKDSYFKDSKSNRLAYDYEFRRNRSIEHVAPQHFSEGNTKFDWDALKKEGSDDYLLKDNIGNLCMISSGQNSSLKDSTFEVKRGHIESYINDSYKGHVESLKMLYIYSNYQEWTLENIRKHSDDSIKWLKESYKY